MFIDTWDGEAYVLRIDGQDVFRGNHFYYDGVTYAGTLASSNNWMPACYFIKSLF